MPRKTQKRKLKQRKQQQQQEDAPNMRGRSETVFSFSDLSVEEATAATGETDKRQKQEQEQEERQLGIEQPAEQPTAFPGEIVFSLPGSDDSTEVEQQQQQVHEAKLLREHQREAVKAVMVDFVKPFEGLLSEPNFASMSSFFFNTIQAQPSAKQEEIQQPWQTAHFTDFEESEPSQEGQEDSTSVRAIAATSEPARSDTDDDESSLSTNSASTVGSGYDTPDPRCLVDGYRPVLERQETEEPEQTREEHKDDRPARRRGCRGGRGRGRIRRLRVYATNNLPVFAESGQNKADGTLHTIEGRPGEEEIKEKGEKREKEEKEEERPSLISFDCFETFDKFVESSTPAQQSQKVGGVYYDDSTEPSLGSTIAQKPISAFISCISTVMTLSLFEEFCVLLQVYSIKEVAVDVVIIALLMHQWPLWMALLFILFGRSTEIENARAEKLLKQARQARQQDDAQAVNV